MKNPKKIIETSMVFIVVIDRLLNNRFTVVSLIVLGYFIADYLNHWINAYLDKKAADKILPKISLKAIKRLEERNITSFDERVSTRRGIDRYLYLKRYTGLLNAVKEIRETSEEDIKLLDIGSGYGNLDLDTAKIKGVKVVGTDISYGKMRVAVEDAKAHDLDCGFITCDAERLPFLKESFDIIVCSEVIEHMLQPQKLIREIYYALKPGGFIILTTPNAHAVSYDTNPLLILEKIISLYIESVLAPRHNIHAFNRRETDHREHLVHRSFSRRELKNLFDGCCITEWHTFHYGLHIYYLSNSIKLVELIEHNLPKMPILRYLGHHWWLKARKMSSSVEYNIFRR